MLLDFVFVQSGELIHVGDTDFDLDGDSSGEAFEIGLVFDEVGVGRHGGLGLEGSRVDEVIVVPFVRLQGLACL